MLAVTLKRDRDAILANIKELGDARVVTVATTIYFPVRYINRGLGEIGDVTKLAGMIGVVQGENYAVLNHLAPIRTEPDSKAIVTIDGMEYYKLDYNPGSKLIYDVKTVQVNTLVYPIFNELLARAVVPWYLSLADEAKMYVSAAKAAGAGIVDSNAIVEMMLAMGVRINGDKLSFYRTVVKDLNDPSLRDYARVPLRSPIYGANNTTSLLIGSRFDDSVTTALNNPSDRMETVEQHLRS